VREGGPSQIRFIRLNLLHLPYNLLNECGTDLHAAPLRHAERLGGGNTMSGPEASVLPIYFVADCSGSMAGEPITEVNKGLTSLLDALQSESMAAAKVRFCIVGFNGNAQCHLEPEDLRNVESMPTLTASGSTSYAAAFRELYQRLPIDVSNLKSAGYIVNRPAVFFLSDGVPNPGDGWESVHSSLTSPDFKQRPNVLAFGIGQADAGTIMRVASKPDYAFVAAQGVDTGQAIAKFIEALTNSVITSGQALASGHAALPIEKPDGFISLAVDTI
jgi:uncharacterized protein YegL